MFAGLRKLAEEGYGSVAQLAGADRIHALSSPMHLKIMLDDSRHVHLGRGSLRAMGRMRVYRTVSAPEKLMLDVGNYCDFARCDILIGGEHFNKHPINFTFADMHILHDTLYQDGEWQVSSFAKGTTRIGHNVVVGLDAKILSGVTIGNGAVIGSGAIITKDVPAFAIVAGNPARVVAMRFDDATIAKLEALRWWDIDPAILWRNQSLLKEPDAQRFIDTIEAIGEGGPLPYDTDDTRLIIKVLAFEGNTPHQYGLGGFEHKGQIRLPETLPPLALAYLRQLQIKDAQETIMLWHASRLFEEN